MTSSHAQRWITAMVAIPLLVLLIWQGGRFIFALVVGLTAAVGLLEYYSFVFSRENLAARAAGLVFGLTLAMSFLADVRFVLTALVMVFFGSAMISMARFDLQTSGPEMFYKRVFGLVYIPLLLGHLILIRGWHKGMAWTFFFMAVMIAGDTAAYYVGKTFGQRKLAPSISPNKTIEGAVGGVAGNVVIGVLFKKACFPEYGWGYWIALVVVMGVAGQLGDLFESMLKRSVKLKDSGRIFPGHGGLLDRIDALLFAAPALYYFQTYVRPI
jgi:phosphatidate cytidylyltransferase